MDTTKAERQRAANRAWQAKNKKYFRDYYAKNREKILEQNRTWRANNYQRAADCNRRSYERNRDKYMKARYGIGREQYNEMLLRQGNHCAICRGNEPGWPSNGRWHIDHCHSTGRVRGLLCSSCNHMIGKAKDNPAVLRAGATYLEQGLT